MRPLPTHAPTSTLTSAADALRTEEVKRTRGFLRIGFAIGLTVAASLLVLPGNPLIELVFLGVLAAALLFSGWIYRSLRSALAVDQRPLIALAFLCVICAQLGILYTGLFSAASLLVVLGLYFFCRTESKIAAFAVYLVAAIAQLVEAVLVLGGFMDDPGFYPIAGRVSIQTQIVGQICIQMMYLLTYWLARITRGASLSSIDELQRATRLVAQREAQLHELRQDLDRALQVGGPGRFTGQVVGDFELGVVIGRGAMGEVYEGRHVDTDDGAAVKLLRRELLTQPSLVERFFREVEAARALDSDHVVRVIDASAPGDPVPYLAMERLRGETLADITRHTPQLPITDLEEMLRQLGGVLDLARDAEIVHRDLKPHNLFKTTGGVWKVLDFGVATLGQHSGTLTQGGVVGTPSYMAPEQARGERVDYRADLYAVGAILYRCLVGQRPFFAPDTPSLLYKVVHGMPDRPTALADLPSQVDDFLAVALAKDREKRFQSAGDLARNFGLAVDGELPDLVRRRARALQRSTPWEEPDVSPTTNIALKG